ncbi:MAG: type I restriction endonuclease subunit R [Candidatus Saccharibacteria bacterium]|nr:type I restriction endonuclease subunit R [Candidatus Saccharibacteria bacterium]
MEYNLILKNKKSTIVAEYTPSKVRASSYQSEADLEQAFINLLKDQAYEYLNIKTEADLIHNLRKQLEKLNDYTFTDSEWQKFFANDIANKIERVSDKTRKIQEDSIRLLKRDNGHAKNISLIDKQNIHNNTLQVINQYEAEGIRTNRYDVTVLVNGLPIVHIELKRRGVAIKEAFNQIKRYQKESFWASNGLFDYVQLFVISNGTHTKYYSNTTREQHIKGMHQAKKNIKRTSNSFEFTNWWADGKNKGIFDLIDFTKTFFSKHSLLNVLTKYCVFTSDQLLLVMRPYQIVATERILNKTEISINYKNLSNIEAGGYIWHTTGSGKTLTSFKTAQLASKIPKIDKVLFVVDRKDLDYQTMKEYDKFQKGAANSNTSTAKLKRQLENLSSDKKIIITTIQKLDRFIKQNQNHEVFSRHLILIFDECHRSQFGDMHKAIVKNFKNYHLFGFTGTPIFAKNASSSGKANLKTTEQVFGKQLHSYTIVDAINDENVLPFRVDYIRTIKEADSINDLQVRDIDRERALSSPERVSQVVQYIINHFDQKTQRKDIYSFDKTTNISQITKSKAKLDEVKSRAKLSGFNSIFAVSSIEVAKKYYQEFKHQQDSSVNLIKIATIFSYDANESEDDLEFLKDENPESIDRLDVSSRDFLENAISDYNAMFGTSFDTSSDKFQNYYKDVSLRMKNRDIDLLIVVNMFLTGFDATTLNTLWVDKNLRMHGLLQAYSRTNRILNSIKKFGNIVNFRNLEKATNEALSLFGDKNASGIVLLKSFEDYYNGYQADKERVKGYSELITELVNQFPVGESIASESEQKDFVRLYGFILRLTNILATFDDFKGKEILTDRQIQDYKSLYLDLHDKFRKIDKVDKENINDDLVFEIELIKQVEINIDYILQLIKRHHRLNREDKELPTEIAKIIDSSFNLRNKKVLIKQFIAKLTPTSNVEDDWSNFINDSQIKELETIINEEDLNRQKTYDFIQNSFKNGEIQETGAAIAEILPPMSRFEQMREEAKQRVLDKLLSFFDKFFDISKI